MLFCSGALVVPRLSIDAEDASNRTFADLEGLARDNSHEINIFQILS